MSIESRYLEGTYLAENPDWHRSDSAWKAAKIMALLSDNRIDPLSMCEVGCGSGDVLLHLQRHMAGVRMTGFDISPQAAQFWREHKVRTGGLNFQLGDFHELNRTTYDVLLMLDVFEHVRDPFSFLEDLRRHAVHFVFHIPLDLSVSGILRGQALIDVRKRVGHLHYYTKDLALVTLLDTGYEILDWRYTSASLNSPNRSLRTRLSAFPRRLAYALNKDFGVRLLGGETLLVLAKSEPVRNDTWH